MSRHTRVRLFSFIVLLGVLVGVLAAPVAPNAQAAPCCSSCDHRFFACMAGTLYPECGGDPGCCDLKVSNCWRWCSFSC